MIVRACKQGHIKLIINSSRAHVIYLWSFINLFILAIEPFLVLGLAYTAYVAAEIFEWSGVVSIIVCGLVIVPWDFVIFVFTLIFFSDASPICFSKSLSEFSDHYLEVHRNIKVKSINKSNRTHSLRHSLWQFSKSFTFASFDQIILITFFSPSGVF